MASSPRPPPSLWFRSQRPTASPSPIRATTWSSSTRTATIERTIDRWRRDWESLDTERYLSHYAADFTSGGMSRAAFADHKRRVNLNKTYVRVELGALEIFRYPGEEDLVLVSFVQRYRSDNFQVTCRKHQYWRREADSWRIVLKESA